MFHGNQYWSADEQQPSASWTRLQDKLFEDALVVFPDKTPDRWEKIAGQVPGKSPWVVRQHYEDLVHDVVEIDSGRVELPRYENEEDSRGWDFESGTSQASFGTKMKQSETERRKGVPWTEEEHRLFLIGLERYGKGDWRSISRNAVVSRTPTQVASHAQKYFLRINSVKKEKKRSSIHDITNVGPSSVDQTNDQNWTTPMATLVRQPMDPRSSLELFSDQGSPLGYRGFRFPM